MALALMMLPLMERQALALLLVLLLLERQALALQLVISGCGRCGASIWRRYHTSKSSSAIGRDRRHPFRLLVDVAVRDHWNAVVSLGENRKIADTCGQGFGATNCFPEVGNQLQFWCNLIQGLPHQQVLLKLLVAAIHNIIIYIYW